ncbi:hypothetical protein M407DRAFT_19198 [Tulasnella calospora MUT 4182]|uniref:Uncharacterized protein n=1 Tax=Tulasnella calospora MUT 4182 TaxID=1051891 RepID=A0A0C3QU79_9AGAM|nr:hypothetical protein M407DRAFT_19198 [Tulasnella calospora MUT 4182]
MATQASISEHKWQNFDAVCGARGITYSVEATEGWIVDLTVTIGREQKHFISGIRSTKMEAKNEAAGLALIEALNYSEE